MDTVPLPPKIERFATEAIAAGRYRQDIVEVLTAGVRALAGRQEAARAELLASVIAARDAGDQNGYVSISAVQHEMEAVITAAARRSA